MATLLTRLIIVAMLSLTTAPLAVADYERCVGSFPSACVGGSPGSSQDCAAPGESSLAYNEVLVTSQYAHAQAGGYDQCMNTEYDRWEAHWIIVYGCVIGRCGGFQWIAGDSPYAPDVCFMSVYQPLGGEVNAACVAGPPPNPGWGQPTLLP